jgi:hypothetical protein
VKLPGCGEHQGKRVRAVELGRRAVGSERGRGLAALDQHERVDIAVGGEAVNRVGEGDRQGRPGAVAEIQPRDVPRLQAADPLELAAT